MSSRVHHGYTAVLIFQHRTHNCEHHNHSGMGKTPWETYIRCLTPGGAQGALVRALRGMMYRWGD